jgi:predicted HAD superfamily hydrolase
MDNYIYSYDIFDTCLIRACGTPIDLWDVLAHDVLGDSADPDRISDFVLIRRKAEGQARKELINDTNEDITIEDIYSYCDFSSLTSISNEDIIKKEIQAENRMLVPVLKIKEEIDDLHRNGNHITFISDMYLPTSFVHNKLMSTGLYTEGDHLYISGEIGKSKSTGHLFDYVRDDLNARFSHWIHQGDNRHSDYEVPKKKGIKAKLISHPLSYYEHKALEYDLDLSSYYIQKIAAICRATRLSMQDTPGYRFAADFIAPLMTTYVHHIFEDASQRGLQHLYFVARDAGILYHIAQQFVHLYPTISIHYLYASRQSLYQPDENCIDYFRQEGLTRPNCAIVDMIGSRKCQQCMNVLLYQHGYESVFAYYYEVTAYRKQSSDIYNAMYYHEKMAGSPHYHHVSHPLYEQYFGMTDQLRTIGYRKEAGKVLPVYEEDLMNMEYKQQVFSINKDVCATFTKHYINAHISSPLPCNHILHATFAHFCHVPKREYLAALDNFFSTSSETTQEPLLVKRNILSILFNKRQYLRWKQGNLIYNSGLLYPIIFTFLQWYHTKKI